jgi:hypothetical protein
VSIVHFIVSLYKYLLKKIVKLRQSVAVNKKKEKKAHNPIPGETKRMNYHLVRGTTAFLLIFCFFVNIVGQTPAT